MTTQMRTLNYQCVLVVQKEIVEAVVTPQSGVFRRLFNVTSDTERDLREHSGFNRCNDTGSLSRAFNRPRR